MREIINRILYQKSNKNIEISYKNISTTLTLITIIQIKIPSIQAKI